MNNKVNLFILIPESTTNFNWINSLDILVDEVNAKEYLKKLKIFKEAIYLEKYDGYYDEESFLNLYSHFAIIEDYFPNPITRELKKLFSDFFDWKKSQEQVSTYTYQIFNQQIINHTLCEISQRKMNHLDENFSLLNNYALTIQNQIEVSINGENQSFDIIDSENQIVEWFSENRIPPRRFQAIPKHDIPAPIIIRGKTISPLYRSNENPTDILKKAIGTSKKELFGYDTDKKMFIVFKYENVEHENQYHGYHVKLDSDEVPDFIKRKFS
ncbi:MAG: hypothetical protein ACOVLC_13170 [Flavobacterium sp.]